MYRIPFNVPPFVGTEMENIRVAVEENHKISGDGPFTKKCKAFLEEKTGTPAFSPPPAPTRWRWQRT